MFGRWWLGCLPGRRLGDVFAVRWGRVGGLAKRKNLVLESFHVGGVAQLGERRVRNAKVGSSILLSSTNLIAIDNKVRQEGYFCTMCSDILLETKCRLMLPR